MAHRESDNSGASSFSSGLPCGPWPALGPSMEQLWQADGGGRQSPRGRTGTTSSTTPSLLLPITLANALALQKKNLHCIAQRSVKRRLKSKEKVLYCLLLWLAGFQNMTFIVVTSTAQYRRVFDVPLRDLPISPSDSHFRHKSSNSATNSDASSHTMPPVAQTLSWWVVG